jgi:hypothetical protein
MTDDWTVETLVKLSATSPDRAYDVGVRIVELTDNRWILANVGAGVFEVLLNRDPAHFIARLSADAARVPRLRRCLSYVGGERLDPTARTRLGTLVRV